MPANAAINAMIARTDVSEGELGSLTGVETGFAVSVIPARAVRVSRINASWVAAPGEGDAVGSIDPGVIVVLPLKVAPGVSVGVADGV